MKSISRILKTRINDSKLRMGIMKNVLRKVLRFNWKGSGVGVGLYRSLNNG